MDFIRDLEQSEVLICCSPNWNTGSEIKRSGTIWDEHVDNIPRLSLRGKLVAIVGLGDSAAFSKYFCDAMEEIYRSFESAGGRMIGHVSAEEYIFDASKSVIDGMFRGLHLDDDNESEKTDYRLESWVRAIFKS